MARVASYCGAEHENCHGLGGPFVDVPLFRSTIDRWLPTTSLLQVHLLIDDQCYNSNTAVDAEAFAVAKNPLYVLYVRSNIPLEQT